MKLTETKNLNLLFLGHDFDKKKYFSTKNI